MKKINRFKLIKIFVYKAPSSGRYVKLVGEYLGPAHRLDRQNREKTPKWPKNDQFRQIHFLTKHCFGSIYTPFDAELQMGFFEINFKFERCLVLELLTKNVAKNRSMDFRPPDGLFFHKNLNESLGKVNRSLHRQLGVTNCQ